MKLSTMKLAPPQQTISWTLPVGPTTGMATPVPTIDIGSAADETSVAHSAPNPLWIITAGLGIFFAFAAAFLAAG